MSVYTDVCTYAQADFSVYCQHMTPTTHNKERKKGSIVLSDASLIYLDSLTDEPYEEKEIDENQISPPEMF